MATKAINQSKINAVADDEENPASDVRTFANGLLNELYPVPIYETHNVGTITSRINTNVTYGINYTKQGNVVHVQGTILTGALISLPNTDLIAFTELEFYPTDNIIQTFKKDGVIFKFNSGKITAVNSMPASTTIYIDLAYVTD